MSKPDPGTTAPPPIKYERAPCPKCGAATLKQAETICQQTRDITDEYTCPGTDFPEDAAGYIRQPTAASLDALDVWIDAEAKREGW